MILLGDEGGFAPSLKTNEAALEYILKAIEAAGYQPGEQIGIALDPAASEFYANGKYVFKKSDKSERSSEQMVEFWANWKRQYPAILSIEDGMSEDDWSGWRLLTDRLGSAPLAHQFARQIRQVAELVGLPASVLPEAIEERGGHTPSV